MLAQPLLTILTPTYNRKHLLRRLYESIATQDISHDLFEWLVVDDGSTDGTSSFLASLNTNVSFRIQIITKRNSGKHRAINYAVNTIKTPWTLILDSDDWLLENSMSKALDLIKTYHYDKSVLAIIATRQFRHRGTQSYASSSKTISYSQFKSLFIKVDTSIIMRTQTLKDYPFPEFKEESFVAEGSCYARCFAEGGILLSEHSIIGCEYQSDGLSSNSLFLRATNPLGAVYTYGSVLASGVNGKERLKALINHYRFYFHCNSIKKKATSSFLHPVDPLLKFLAYIFFILDIIRLIPEIGRKT